MHKTASAVLLTQTHSTQHYFAKCVHLRPSCRAAESCSMGTGIGMAVPFSSWPSAVRSDLAVLLIFLSADTTVEPAVALGLPLKSPAQELTACFVVATSSCTIVLVEFTSVASGCDSGSTTGTVHVSESSSAFPVVWSPLVGCADTTPEGSVDGSGWVSSLLETPPEPLGWSHTSVEQMSTGVSTVTFTLLSVRLSSLNNWFDMEMSPLCAAGDLIVSVLDDASPPAATQTRMGLCWHDASLSAMSLLAGMSKLSITLLALFSLTSASCDASTATMSPFTRAPDRGTLVWRASSLR